MNLYRLFSYFFVVKFVFVVVLGVLASKMLQNYLEQIDCEKKRINSIALANDIEDASHTLTRYCRSYAATGDSTWEIKYRDYLAVLRGEKPNAAGRKISLTDSLKSLGVTELEAAKFQEVRQTYGKASEFEERSFNAMKGVFADEMGRYTKTGAPNKQLAMDIIFSNEYRDAKNRTLNAIHEFEVMVEERTTEDYEFHTRVNDYLIWGIILVIAIILSVMTLSFIILRKKLIKRNVKLEESYKRAEESESRYRVLFDNSPDAYVIVREGVITASNQAALNMLRCTEDELIGKGPADISPEFQPDGRSSSELAMEKTEEAIKYGGNTFDWNVKCFDDRRLCVEVSLVPMVINGYPSILATWRNITDRKMAEKALRESEESLRESNAAKDKFFSIISHDLKGPYNALLNLSEILREEYDELSEEEIKSFIEGIDDVASNSYKLLENLLEWAKIQTCKLCFNPEKVNLLTELRSSIKLMEESAQSKNITFINDIKHSYDIYTDKYMLDTVVRNLVGNAIKFTNTGGNITLSVETMDDHHQFSIRDNGVGMNAEKKEKLFMIGETKSITTRGTDDEKGTGLGLILCKEMIDMHGGSIWVESEEGKGTTFTFTIPIRNNN